MRFRNIFSRDEAYPEGRYIVLEHQTPEFLWQPRYQTHPNGAQGLDAALVCADDVPAERDRLATITGVAPDAVGDGVFRFLPRGGGRIELHSTGNFVSRYGWRPPSRPCFAGAEVSFASRHSAAQMMVDNGVPVERIGDEWFVAPRYTNGFILRLGP